MTPAERLANLLSPLSVSEFFERHYESSHVVLRGGAERAIGVLSTDELLRAVARTKDLAKVRVDIDQIPRDAGDGIDALRAYAAEGHPVVWNTARGVSPGIDALEKDLVEVLQASVCPNVYSTGPRPSPFGMHFDGHEIFVLHLEGRKEWMLSEVRAVRPVDAPGWAEDLRAALRDKRAESEARIAERVVLEPGDVLYLPRGQFHDARALGGRSLHVTFGVQPLAGPDVLDALTTVALGHRAFRSFMPLAPMDPDGSKREAEIRTIEDAIVQVIRTGALRRALDIVDRVKRSRD
jgi:ribosomal protein L16 Arg81 hydroxylase